jgi:hypothetical protein
MSSSSDDELSQEGKAAFKEFDKEVKALQEEVEGQGRAVCMVGSIIDREEINSLEDIHTELQVVTPTKDEVAYVEKFVTSYNRIGDDIEDEGQVVRTSSSSLPLS